VRRQRGRQVAPSGHTSTVGQRFPRLVRRDDQEERRRTSSPALGAALMDARDGPGRTRGCGYWLQRGRLKPQYRLFGEVTSRTRHQRPYARTGRHTGPFPWQLAVCEPIQNRDAWLTGGGRCG
jgi:hypothetical protein